MVTSPLARGQGPLGRYLMSKAFPLPRVYPEKRRYLKDPSRPPPPSKAAACFLVGVRELHLAVDAARPQQGIIQNVDAVGRLGRLSRRKRAPEKGLSHGCGSKIKSWGYAGFCLVSIYQGAILGSFLRATATWERGQFIANSLQ